MEGIEKLAAFVGKWKGDVEVSATPLNSNGGMNFSTVVGRFALENRFVFVDEVMELGGKVTFRSHKVLGFDPRLRLYTLHFFDSNGANPPTRAEGSWEEDTLTLEQQTPFGRVRYVYAFSGEGFEHRTEVSEDGTEWSGFMRGAYSRLGARP